VYVIFDSTFDGLLSAAAFCFRQKMKPQGIISELDEQPIIDCLSIPREANIHRLFRRHLRQVCGETAGGMILDTAFHAFLSEQPGMADQIWHYFARSLELRQDPAPRLFEPAVAAVVQAARKVGGQAHQFLGLLRFKEVCPQLYVADFTPDYHVLPLILTHFTDRLSDQCFAIRDLRRRIVAFHPPGGPVDLRVLADDTIPSADALPSAILADSGPFQALPSGLPESRAGLPPGIEDTCEEMWRRYLKRLSIPERRNPALQKANLPKKYWKYLTEDPARCN
jgi:probable DNA metabolism protein